MWIYLCVVYGECFQLLVGITTKYPMPGASSFCLPPAEAPAPAPTPTPTPEPSQVKPSQAEFRWRPRQPSKIERKERNVDSGAFQLSLTVLLHHLDLHFWLQQQQLISSQSKSNM